MMQCLNGRTVNTYIVHVYIYVYITEIYMLYEVLTVRMCVLFYNKSFGHMSCVM